MLPILRLAHSLPQGASIGDVIYAFSGVYLTPFSRVATRFFRKVFISSFGLLHPSTKCFSLLDSCGCVNSELGNLPSFPLHVSLPTPPFPLISQYRVRFALWLFRQVPPPPPPHIFFFFSRDVLPSGTAEHPTRLQQTTLFL